MQRYKLSHWKVKWSLISGTFKTTEVIAYDYNDSLIVFELKTGISKHNVLKSIKSK